MKGNRQIRPLFCMAFMLPMIGATALYATGVGQLIAADFDADGREDLAISVQNEDIGAVGEHSVREVEAAIRTAEAVNPEVEKARALVEVEKLRVALAIEEAKAKVAWDNRVAAEAGATKAWNERNLRAWEDYVARQQLAVVQAAQNAIAAGAAK